MGHPVVHGRAALRGQTLQPEAKWWIDSARCAPYGAVLGGYGACTLCLSALSLCRRGALGDNPDLPQLRLFFKKMPCLQCGLLCPISAPEDAITLETQAEPEPRRPLPKLVLHEKNPFAVHRNAGRCSA